MNKRNPQSLLEALAEMHANAQHGADEAPPKIDLQAAIMRLREIAARHLEADQGPRFRVGDIITPAADATVKGAGEPHIVISVKKAEHNFSNGEAPGSCQYGIRPDMRVVGFVPSGEVAAFWVESAEFIPWAAR